MDHGLAIVNGRIFGSPGATGVRIEAGRIAAVGSDAVSHGAREVVDAGGALVLPGLDDAHLHLRSGARQMDHAVLYPLATQAEVLAAVAAHAAANPDRPWVRGRGWLYAAFEGGLPHRRHLDAVVPDRPAYLRCYDGHTAWANSAALRLAGIDRSTPDPFAGVIVRDGDGEPTGVLKEDAQLLVEAVIPTPSVADDQRAVAKAIAAFHRVGLTAVQDASGSLDDLAFFSDLAQTDAMPLRLRFALDMPHGQTAAEWRDLLHAYEAAAFPLRGGARLDTGILKGFVDGVIEARTASMLAPYEGDAGSGGAGLPNWEPEALRDAVTEADRRGWQVELHAIGDRGVRMALDAYENAATVNGPWRGDPHGCGAVPGTHQRRHRVEHIETIDPADVARFARLGVVASMQPFHGDPSPNQIDIWAANIGPDRASRAWAWGSIRRAGGRLAFGSDWPVVPVDPWIAVGNAVRRQNADGRPEGGWLPGERLSVADALEAYTAGPAYAAFGEHRRGSLALGMDADLAVLDRDLLNAPASAIIGTGVRLTVLDGRIVHRMEAPG